MSKKILSFGNTPLAPLRLSQGPFLASRHERTPVSQPDAETAFVGRFGASAGPPLGIYAKTEAAPGLVDTTTGEVLHDPADIEGRSPAKSRAERWALKAVVNKILPASRTSKCMRWVVPHKQVEVYRSAEGGKAFYGNLQVCASVWACPCCAAKISERRRVELSSAIEKAKEQNFTVQLLTVTVPHGLGDDVTTIVDRMLDAWRRITTGRAGKNLKAKHQIEGTVRSLEVTYGQNGFHPHLHVLLFQKSGSSPDQVQVDFSPLWQSSCVKSGLPRPSDQHGCRVDDGSYAAAYASKWGLESELTKSHVKQGKRDSLTPWDFLRSVLTRSRDAEKHRALFAVYANAFRGRRQLYWSNGLRKNLGLNAEITDEEIAVLQEENADLFASLTLEQWRAILVIGAEETILTIVENYPSSLSAILDSLVKQAAVEMQRRFESRYHDLPS